MDENTVVKQDGYAPTAAQTDAIEANDKTLLLSAAAGSGKTATLTARVVRLLTVDRRDVSKMVIVTFTVAAAQDLKTKLTEKLTKAISECKDADLSKHLAEQLLLIPDADIGTIDSFCRRLVLEFSDCAGLSPSYRTCDSNEEKRLLREIAEPLVERLFAGEEPDVATPEEFRSFVSHLVDPRRLDKLFDVIFDAKKKADNLVRGVDAFDDYARYIEEVCDRPPEETVFGKAILGRLADFASDAKEPLRAALAAAKDETLTVQSKFCGPLTDALDAAEVLACARSLSFAEAAGRVAAASQIRFAVNSPEKAYMTEATEAFLEAARGAFFSFRDRLKDTYLPFFGEDGTVWSRDAKVLYPVALIFSRLMHRFDELVAAEKKRQRIASFADVERAVYRLLVSPDGSKTAVAREVSARYTDVFVDEYQDVNPLQHEIFRAISTERNRFLVGDVKQSIYGWRGAAPSVFIDLKTSFPPLDGAGDGDCAKIFLSENFRCDEPVVNFTNAVFGPLFGATSASIGYRDEDDRLRFAKPADKCSPKPILPVVKLFEKIPSEDGSPAPDAECAWIAKEIKRLITTCTRPNPDWKEGTDLPRYIPIKPEDIAILLRAAAGKTSPFRLALLREGIPVTLETNENLFGFPEVRLALCLLNAVDNPRRDVPLVGLLRSPLYDFSPDLLAKIRLGASRSDLPFYDALKEYCEKNDCPEGKDFLSQLERFRRAAEGMAIDRLVLKLFTETGLLQISGGANPDNGRENLLLFYQYARSFASMPYRGLYRFIEYLNELERDAEELKLVPPTNAKGVRVMTIHHSKGLEFPVVFVSRALSGKKRQGDGAVAFSSRFGLMPAILDETGLARFDTPFRKVSDFEKKEFEREEGLRTLYVALTRARERLYVTGSLDKNETAAGRMRELYRCARPLTRHDVIHKRTYSGTKGDKFEPKATTLSPLDRIVCAVGLDTSAALLFPTPEEEARVREAERLEEERRRALPGALAPAPGADVEETGASDNRSEPSFDFYELKNYPAPWLINVPGKISVSVLSPAPLAPADGDPTDVSPRKESDDEPAVPRFISGKSKAEDPALRGTATHEFLQYCDLRQFKETSAEVELNRLIDRGFLTKEALDLVDLHELELFRKTTLLDEMLSSTLLRREFRFSRITPAADFVTDEEKKKQAGAGTIMVQGVIDCVFVTERGELVLLDYKTDRLRGGAHASQAVIDRFVERHRLQLYFYAKALADIFGREPARILLYPLCLGRPVPVILRGNEGEQALTGFYVRRPGEAFRELLQ